MTIADRIRRWKACAAAWRAIGTPGALKCAANCDAIAAHLEGRLQHGA